MASVIGIGGAHRNAAAALCRDGRVAGFIEEERLTRVKGGGLRVGQLPDGALEYVRGLNAGATDPAIFAAAEADIPLPAGGVRIDHHEGHANVAFASSPFQRAAVLVCDTHAGREISLWAADVGRVVEVDLAWHGHGLAAIYSMATEALGFTPQNGEHRVEALARLAPVAEPKPWPAIFSFHGDHLDVDGDAKARLALAAGSSDDVHSRSRIAADVQAAIGSALLELVKLARKQSAATDLCLAGGLFYNSYFTTLVARSGVFDRVSVPVNPGNAGTAIGSALAASRMAGHAPDRDLSPFLGPEFDSEHIKGVLDNCKLSYEYLHDGAVVDLAVDALKRGLLVGWFQGRMEWGTRALGNRSIVANPFSPYTLENINRFLKRREPYRPYSVSVLEGDLDKHFVGPAASPFMEYEYDVRDRDRFRGMLPGVGHTLRVQTVANRESPFGRLLLAFGEAVGIPVLVNTSFNGFHEPIVCSPRDAVRVFYGTGLDVAIIGNFVIRK